MSEANHPLLSLRISADYPQKPGVLRNVALDVHAGEIVGLVGRSGEGKSTITMAILGLLGYKGGRANGQILFQGRDLLRLSNKQIREVRGKEIGLVPQSPLSSLNPHLRLVSHLEEARRAHHGAQADWGALMRSVSLPSTAEFLRGYPPSLSVGMAQRFLIALAMVHRPPLLLADEPTSALDLITQAEILQLFRKINQEQRVTMLYISHDLASVASLCHRVAILHEGEIVECGPTVDVFERPGHDYTKRLIDAIPQVPTTLSNPLARNNTSLDALSLALAKEPRSTEHKMDEVPNV